MPIVLRSLTRKPKPPTPPTADQRFTRVMQQLQQKAGKVKQHPTPAKKADEAAKAAKGPPNEKAAGAKGKQVDKIKEAKTKKPEPESFLSMLRAEIEKVMPRTLDDTQKFMKGGDAGALKGGLKGNVAQQKQAATGDTSTATKQAPSTAGVPGKESQAIPGEPPPPSPDVPAGDAMPAPKADADVSVQDSKQDTEAAMEDAEVTETQCKKANDSRFSAVLEAKGQVGKQADEAPGKYRSAEKGVLNAAVAGARASGKAGAAAMMGVKGRSKQNVLTRQQAAKQKDEAERKKVADTIESIYNRTKTQVEEKLSALDEEVNGIFDAGTDAALAAMKAYTEARIAAYKSRRYSGLIGKGRWLRDQFKGLPEEANRYYVEGRNLFAGLMDAVIVRVANLVEQRLREAKALVAKGQGEIKTYVDSLPKNLKSVGQAAQKEVGDRFKELERGIEDKKGQLASQLAQKYKEAFDKADKALKEIQDSNKGLVQKFVEKLGEIIKIIREFKGKLMAALRKGWSVIKGILADPIGFLGNLIAALKAGFNQFKANIKKWLIKGLIGWLFGALAEAGVTPPADFSLPSILKLVLQILGITYDRMRAKAVKMLGPTAVTIIEQLIKYVQTLVTGGPAALWAQVQGDLADLKERVLGDIRDMIITEVIKAAVLKIVSMFNPVGAFVQAVLAIYNTVMFVVEQASRIAALVSSVIDSVAAIAGGAIGAAANRIEQALGAAIPIVIGFLARLVGVGGLPKKATAVVKKVQTAIDKAIDKMLGKMIAGLKKLFGAIGPKADGRTEAQKKADIQRALAEARSAASGKISWLKLKLKLVQIKRKYKLTSLNVKGAGGKLRAKAVINPEGEGDLPTPPSEAKAKAEEAKGLAEQTGAQAAEGKATAAQIKPPKRRGKGAAGATAPTAAATTPAATPATTPAATAKSGARGMSYQEQRAQELSTREGQDVTRLPTQSGKNPQGIDAAFVVDQKTLELVEIKEPGASTTVFQPQSSKKGTNVRAGTTKIEIGTSGDDKVSAAAAHLKQQPGDFPKLAGGAKFILERPAEEEGKTEKVKLDNKISGITNKLEKNLVKMYKLIREASKDPTLGEAAVANIQALLADESATVKFVIDLGRGNSMSASEREVAKKLIEASYEKLKAASGSIKAKLDVVVRTVNTEGKNVDEKL